MSRGFFITGTDTGVGKTLVACGLAAAFRDAGFKVGVMKPAESGCHNEHGRMVPRDAHLLKAAAGSDQPIERICPYRLGLPAAPSVAAAHAATRIRPDFLVRLYRDMDAVHDLMLVEGAGGLLVPLHSSYTFADLARELELPVLVVVGNRLGAINQALLTFEHAACLNLKVYGYFLNDIEEGETPATSTNAATLQEMTRVPCAGRIPFLQPQGSGAPPETRSDLGRLFQRHTRLDHLKQSIESAGVPVERGSVERERPARAAAKPRRDSGMAIPRRR